MYIMEEQKNQNQQSTSEQQPVSQPVVSKTNEVDSSDIEKNKAMAIIGYIFPILFFIPLLNDETKNSPFARFHANQQLDLLIYWIAGWIIAGIISFILAITIFLIPLIPLVGVVYFIIGVIFIILGAVDANRGIMKKLPLIGGIELIK